MGQEQGGGDEGSLKLKSFETFGYNRRKSGAESGQGAGGRVYNFRAAQL